MTPLEWVTSLAGVLETKPVTVSFGDLLKPNDPKNKKPPEVYAQSVWYRREFEPPPGCQRPDKYVLEMLYVVGFLPRCEDLKVCYTVEGDEREWYLIGGFYGNTKATRRKPMEPSEFNPFGNFFMLGPWDDAEALPAYRGQKIDHYEPKPYQRVPLKIDPPLLRKKPPCEDSTGSANTTPTLSGSASTHLVVD